MQDLVLKKLIAGMKVGFAGNAVAKTVLVVLYYVIVGVLNLMTFVYFDVNRENLTQDIICNTAGNQECDAIVDPAYNVLSVVGPVSQALIPVVVVILFSFNRRDCSRIKDLRKSCLKR